MISSVIKKHFNVYSMSEEERQVRSFVTSSPFLKFDQNKKTSIVYPNKKYYFENELIIKNIFDEVSILNKGLQFLGDLSGVYLQKDDSDLFMMLIKRLPEEIQSITKWEKVIDKKLAKENGMTLKFIYETADASTSVLVWNSFSSWLRIIKNFDWECRQIKLCNIPIKLPIQVGKIEMTRLLWKGIKSGDVLFLDECTFNIEGEGKLFFNSCHYCINYFRKNDVEYIKLQLGDKMSEEYTDEDVIETDENVFPNKVMSENPSESQNVEEEHSLLDTMPMTISVRIGHINLNIDELSSLKQGKICNLESACPGKVQLYVDETEIARGELIDVDGVLAVQILKNWRHS